MLGPEWGKRCAWKYHPRSACPDWENLRQRELDTAIAEINKKTDLNIAIESLERSTLSASHGLIFDTKEK